MFEASQAKWKYPIHIQPDYPDFIGDRSGSPLVRNLSEARLMGFLMWGYHLPRKAA